MPFLLLLLLLPLALPALADDAVKPGHSMQGDVFNEGPRQFAHLIPGCTSVHFPVTTNSAEAQQFIDQGVTQLHGFWYFEAERSFRQAAFLDANCAMAYWGMAMANVNNEKRAAGFMAGAVKRRDGASPREQRWIDAWKGFFTGATGEEKPRRETLAKAMESLCLDFPEDLEARAFLLLQLWENSSEGIPLPSRLAVAALAQPVLAANPMHPGIHHYLIHLWNQDSTDAQALPDAARCGQSAPAIAHLWHMSGHTYAALHRYADAAWQQEASARVDHAYMAGARIMPEQIFNYAHNNEWLVRDLEYVGRVHEALALAKNLVELPRLGPARQAAWRMGRERLLELGLSFELWDELTALEATPYLAAEASGPRETERLRALGIAWFAKGDVERGAEKLGALERQLSETRAERTGAADRAAEEAKKAGQTAEEITKATEGAKHGFDTRIAGLENAVAEVRMSRALAAGDLPTAREELTVIKDLPPARAAAANAALGNLEAAGKALQSEIQRDPEQVLSYALLAAILERAGEHGPAESILTALRQRSADLDLDTPVFARLAPIAQRLGWPDDWRLPRPVGEQTGARPPLTELGPLRWEPYAAPDFALPDRDRRTVSLGGRSRHPVLVVFYLGAGCSGCIEQLNKLAPVAPQFAAAGIDLIAISTDTPEGLKATFDQAKEGAAFSFPIVSDSGLETFKAYRAYDDFESMPLHGAFLVDGAGLVRWQNISYQPFMEPEWLVEEAKRLLAMPLPAPATAAASR